MTPVQLSLSPAWAFH